MITHSRLRVAVTGADHSRGPIDAPLVLVEYGDFECPHCGQANPILKRIQEKLSRELRFVFREFPITLSHPHAMGAAKAAEAAAAQGKFWEMHDLLYEHQDHLEEESLLEYAASLELDLGLFTQEMKSKTVEDKVENDFYGGVRSGVPGTPGFFINGFRYAGDWSYESLLAALMEVKQRIDRVKKAG